MIRDGGETVMPRAGDSGPILYLLTAAGILAAQTAGSATLAGTVTDTTGAVVVSDLEAIHL